MLDRVNTAGQQVTLFSSRLHQSLQYSLWSRDLKTFGFKVQSSNRYDVI
jgi:hypothetical protein